MKKLVLLIALLTFNLVSCTKVNETLQSLPISIPPLTTTSTSPTSTPMEKSNSVQHHVTIDLKITGGTEAQRNRLQNIAKQTEAIINSTEFKDRILGTYYNGWHRFFGTKHDNQYVYDHMLQADELSRGKPDYVWQYDLRIAKGTKGTLGWTFAGSAPIYFNSTYLDSRDSSGISGTFCHEQAHKLGFTHTVERTKDRPNSVPYGVGTICAELYKSGIKK